MDCILPGLHWPGKAKVDSGSKRKIYFSPRSFGLGFIKVTHFEKGGNKAGQMAGTGCRRKCPDLRLREVISKEVGNPVSRKCYHHHTDVQVVQR